MTDTEADEFERDNSSSGDAGAGKAVELNKKSTKKEPRRKGGIGLFLREVIAEMRKVVYPTRQELMTYTAVVIVFVVVIMLFVSALDFGIAKLMSWAFGG